MSKIYHPMNDLQQLKPNFKSIDQIKSSLTRREGHRRSKIMKKKIAALRSGEDYVASNSEEEELQQQVTVPKETVQALMKTKEEDNVKAEAAEAENQSELFSTTETAEASFRSRPEMGEVTQQDLFDDEQQEPPPEEDMGFIEHMDARKGRARPPGPPKEVNPYFEVPRKFKHAYSSYYFEKHKEAYYQKQGQRKDPKKDYIPMPSSKDIKDLQENQTFTRYESKLADVSDFEILERDSQKYKDFIVRLERNFMNQSSKLSVCVICWGFIPAHLKKKHLEHESFLVTAAFFKNEESFIRLCKDHGKIAGSGTRVIKFKETVQFSVGPDARHLEHGINYGCTEVFAGGQNPLRNMADITKKQFEYDLQIKRLKASVGTLEGDNTQFDKKLDELERKLELTEMEIQSLQYELRGEDSQSEATEMTMM